jgi:tetratricopeptide (TPR) repeat protein
MAELFSIPVFTGKVVGWTYKVDWEIPGEAEEALARHNPGVGVSLDEVFRARMVLDPLAHGMDWLLVVLPGRYPIGGYLAAARGGSKSNLIQMDERVFSAAAEHIKQRWQGVANFHPLYFPSMPRVDTDIHTSLFWVMSKGLLRDMAATVGGWLQDVADRVAAVPAKGCWVYLADAPPEDFLASVRPDNAARYAVWQRRYCGPAWSVDLQMPDSWVLNCAMEASGRQRLCFLKQYLRHHPGDARAWALRSITHENLRQKIAAVASAKRAVKAAPEWWYARRALAYHLAEAGRMEEAIEQSHLILADSPLDLGTWMELSLHLLAVPGGEEERVRCYQRLIELHPRPALFMVEHGELQYRLGDPATALRLFEQAVLLEPDLPLAVNNYGFLLAEQGELEKALVLCRRACELEETANNLDSLGFVYMRRGELEKAREILERALALDENHVESQQHWEELERIMADER